MQIKLHFSDSSDEIQTQDEVDAKEKVTVPLPPSKVDVTLTLILDLPPILHLTPDAPQAYSLAFKGKTLYESRLSIHHTDLLFKERKFSQSCHYSVCNQSINQVLFPSSPYTME